MATIIHNAKRDIINALTGVVRLIDPEIVFSPDMSLQLDYWIARAEAAEARVRELEGSE